PQELPAVPGQLSPPCQGFARTKQVPRDADLDNRRGSARSAEQEAPPERGCGHIYFAGAASLAVSSAVFSPCLLASFRSRSMTPARRSCLIRVSCAFFCSAKNL